MNQKNILFITSDQQHFSTLGALNPKIKTPNLDRLAERGILFERAYCPNPVCTPSRASMITGQYPSFHEAWTIGCMLPEDTRTIGHQLMENGYRTGLIGKAHFHPLARTEEYPSLECLPILRDLDFWRDFRGPWYGFDTIELTRNHTDEGWVGMHYAIWMEEQGFDWEPHFEKIGEDGRRINSKERLSWSLPEEFHYNIWIREKTNEFMDQAVAENKPFMAWASFHDPHPSYLVPEPWASMYNPEDMEPGEFVEGEHAKNPPHFALTRDRDADWSDYREEHGSHGCHYHNNDKKKLQEEMAVYYGMVSFMDHEIGKILDHLDEKGLTEDTLIVFTTDHGHFLGQHGLVAKGPFHYEDMLKIPMIAAGPGVVSDGKKSSALQSLVDLVPTWLDYAGLPIGGQVQGISQWDVWQGKEKNARDWCLVENRHQPRKIHLRTLVTDRYKITVYRERPEGELFDLAQDPDERNNLWDDPESQELKLRMMQQFLFAEMEREPTRMARIAGA